MDVTCRNDIEQVGWVTGTLLAVVALVVPLVLWSSPASARAVRATVLSFTATPEQPDATGAFRGGPVDLTATVADAASCTFSATRIPGLPVTLDCSGGRASITVNVPFVAKKASTVKFRIMVTDPAGATTKAPPIGFPYDPTSPLTGIANVVGNASSYCALESAGGVDCWGSNSDGQTGHGTDLGSELTARPVRGVGGSGHLSGATALITTGAGYCALLADQSVVCWGDNAFGELGIGTLAGPQTCSNGNPCSKVPVAVDFMPPLNVLHPVYDTAAIAITGMGAGSAACAVMTTGKAKCWGINAAGSLGDGTSIGPLACPGGTSCDSLPNYVLHSVCASPLRGCQNVPLDNVEYIVSEPGDSSFCAVLTLGYPSCWGNNNTGQLGTGSSGEGSNLAVDVLGVIGQDHLYWVTQIVGSDPSTYSGVGTDHGNTGNGYCARLQFGSIACWGANDVGQLGIGTSSGPSMCGLTMPCSTVPVLVHAVGGGSGLVDGSVFLEGGTGGYCAVESTAGVACWGQDAYGSLGTGLGGAPNMCQTIVPCSVLPVGVSSTSGSGLLLHASTLVSDGLSFCAVSTGGVLVDCWGSDNHGQLGSSTVPPPQIDQPAQVLGIGGKGKLPVTGSMSRQTVPGSPLASFCAVAGDGSVACWGSGGLGQIGDGAGTDSNVPDGVRWFP
jgi:alpha-tubulin suppressor-like RCC1 family protein